MPATREVHGKKLRYEPPPQKDTLGFWVDASDWAEWKFESPGTGVFEVEFLQGCGKGSGGAQIELAVGDQKLTAKIEETGHFQAASCRDRREPSGSNPESRTRSRYGPCRSRVPPSWICAASR